MPFYQSPPTLGNQYDDDRVLRSYLTRALPREMLGAIEPELRSLGELSGGSLYQLQLADRENEPRLISWDPWGQRVDRIEVTPLWERAARIAAEQGIVGTAYERRHGAHSRVHQFALAYLFTPSTDTYSCPLAMTDGAARTLIAHDNAELIAHAVPHLTSRDPDLAWTSGQWMTERTGGSDVAVSETVARKNARGEWELFGTKWFTSATTSPMALTLGRPEGNPAGGSGLALFYLETKRPDGTANGIAVHRLKDKLGTRKVPTAELSLEGTVAVPVAGLANGVRNITPMLNITRMWNAVSAVAGMRRAIALARDFARRRTAFGALLCDKPLHADTLAGLQAEFEGALQLAFSAVELLGRDEAGTITDRERVLLRLLTPIVKLTTGRQAVTVASEALEAFGGAGYVEDTGLPVLLRDAQVLSIWEGTTNVLSLDAIRAAAKADALGVLAETARGWAAETEGTDAAPLAKVGLDAIEHATRWSLARAGDGASVEAGARRFAMTLGRALELVLLARHAAWSVRSERDGRSLAAAARLAHEGVDLVRDRGASVDEVRALADDRPIAVTR